MLFHLRATTFAAVDACSHDTRALLPKQRGVRCAGHTLERRRGAGGAEVELLRDHRGRLLAVAVPQWSDVAQDVVSKVRSLSELGSTPGMPWCI